MSFIQGLASRVFSGSSPHSTGIPSQMRAILVKDGNGPIENLYIGDTPTPVPGPGQVLVKVKAFGLNRMDLGQRQGRKALSKDASPILGVEFSGTVAQFGPDPEAGSVQAGAIKKWQLGDEVYGLANGGAYAEYIVAHATHLIAKPKHLSWVEAASIPEAYLTAFQALVLLSDIKANEDVLIHAGASGVGVSAIQLSRFFGANSVIATSSTTEKLDYITSMPHGATHGVNYKTQHFPAEVKKITNNKGVDVIVDFVAAGYWENNLDSFAFDGRMVVLAALGGTVVPQNNLGVIVGRRLRIMFSGLRSRTTEYQASLIARFAEVAAGHITGVQGDGDMHTHIYKVYPWDQIQDGHRDMATNVNIGKIVMEIV